MLAGYFLHKLVLKLMAKGKRVIAVTPQDCIQFSSSILHFLEATGFHVNSLDEAYSCISSVMSEYTDFELTNSDMVVQCPRCHLTFGSKNIDPSN